MSHFLAPVLALILWSLIIWCVMYARRIPAMQKAKIHPDNYNHLMEQPTIFYALMFYIALTGGESGLMGYLAWAYVILRVIHSLVQITSNKVMVRFAVFTLSTLVLIVMACAQAAKLF